MMDLVTLITGASAGIGTELARVFASNGHRLTLVDRRGDRLTMLASEIVAAGGAEPILIPCDLEHPNACDKIEAALAAAGVEVEFVEGQDRASPVTANPDISRGGAPTPSIVVTSAYHHSICHRRAMPRLRVFI
jgi:NAD(P)-dependent dehydrogenase (short-subunit alcohol dehydrogenase family)